MSELYQGPVQQWEPDAAWYDSVAEMLASDDGLYRAYGEAYTKRCYIKEVAGGRPDDPEAGFTAVGDMDKLVEAEFRSGIELDQNELSLGDCIALGAFPGSGVTRVERVLDGVRQVEKARGKTEVPEELDLYGSFSEKGYLVEVFMPKNASQKQQWTVRLYSEKSRELVKEETIPMSFAPVFGVDVEDEAVLNTRVDEILNELA